MHMVHGIGEEGKGSQNPNCSKVALTLFSYVQALIGCNNLNFD